MSATLDIPAILKQSSAMDKDRLLVALLKDRMKDEGRSLVRVEPEDSAAIGCFLSTFHVGDMDLNEDTPYMKELKRRAENLEGSLSVDELKALLHEDDAIQGRE